MKERKVCFFDSVAPLYRASLNTVGRVLIRWLGDVAKHARISFNAKVTLFLLHFETLMYLEPDTYLKPRLQCRSGSAHTKIAPSKA